MKEAVIKNFQNSTENICVFYQKETPIQVFFCKFREVFTNIIYRAPPVAASGLNISIFSNLNPNSCRSLFTNCINPIGPWGPKPNNKIIKSITNTLSIVLELSKAYSKENLRKKKCPCKWLLECEGTILVFIKFSHRFL